MKKIYLLLVGLIAFACMNTTNAQTVLFSENFSGGVIPATWTSVGTPAWAYTTVGGNYGGQLLSTTAADGYAIFDSDGFGAGAQDADLITPSFATTGQANVRVQFQELFRQYGTSIATVSIRTNGGAWNDIYTIGLGMANGDITANPNIIDVDVTAFAANSPDVQLKFNFVGNYDYWWMFDDLFVYAPAAFDAAVTAANISEYTAIPLSQVTPLTPSCEITNNGANDLTGVSVQTTITNGVGTIVYLENLNQGNLAAGFTSNLTATTSYTPIVADFYLVEFIISANEVDGEPLNDTLVTAIDVTDSLYARDFFYLTGDAASLGGPWFLGAGNDGQIGNVFTAEATTDLVSATAVFAGAFAIGDQTQANLYSMVAGAPNTLIASSTVLTVAQADTPVIFYDFIFPASTTLTAGSDYFISVQQNAASAANFAIYTSNNIYTPNTSFLQTGVNPWEEFGVTGLGNSTLMLRANVYTPPVSCAITDVAAGTQTACVSSTNEYTQQVTVTYSNAPATGMLNVNGQTFALGTSPQTVTLSGLTSNGASTNVTAFFTAETACTYAENAVFTAPAACPCTVSDVSAGTQTPCVNTNNEYTQQVTVTYTNAPATGMLSVNGQTFALGTSPQTVTLSGLDSDGAVNNVTAFFTAETACTYTENAVFTAPASCLCPTINVSVATVNVTNCSPANGEASATVTGGGAISSYAWTPGGGTTQSITGLSAGSYSVLVTDVNGCTGSGSGSLINTSGFNAVIGGTSNVSCFGGNDGEIIVSVTGGTGTITYAWSDQTFSSTVSTRSDLVAGSYTIVVTDGGSCTSTVGAVTITQPALLEVVIDNSVNVTCNGANDGIINTTISGGTAPYTTSWTSTTATTPDLANLMPGSYQISVEDSKGCMATATAVVITQPMVLTLATSNAMDVTCNGANNGSFTATATGGTAAYMYSVNSGAAQASGNFTGLGGNTYTASVTDANGCSASATPFAIVEPAAFSVAITASTNVTCNAAANGSIDATVTGGQGALIYNWGAGNPATEDLSDLTPDTYTLTVTDANSCTASSAATTISEPVLLSGVATSTPESTSGAADGTATVTPAGGTAPYTYLWDDALNQTTQTATGLNTGTYTYVITDANNCEFTFTTDVDLTNGIMDLDLNTFKVYPNPANREVTVTFDINSSKEMTIKFYNTIGKVVLTDVSSVNGFYNKTFNIGDLSAGIYFIEVSNEDGASIQKLTVSK